MIYGIIFGSNMFIGTNGVLSYEKEGKIVEFFRIREIFRERDEGSYLAVDCDIKDADGNREIKLFKSKPVVEREGINVTVDKNETNVSRADGSVVINIRQSSVEESKLPNNGPVVEFLKANKLDAIITITGDFFINGNHIVADNDKMLIGTTTVSGNLGIGTKGLLLTDYGIAF